VPLREILRQTLVERYRDRGLQVFENAERGPLARFPAAHPAVGDLELGAGAVPIGINVRIGDVLHDIFHSIDAHLDEAERNQRVVREVVRFLDELFADRLLFWKAADGRGRGWRERGFTDSLDPLVLDNRRYLVYLWSRPLGEWQAIPVIFGRGRIENDREYEILRIQLVDAGADPLDNNTRARVAQLVKAYEGRRE
jgi:hypothetical protein